MQLVLLKWASILRGVWSVIRDAVQQNNNMGRKEINNKAKCREVKKKTLYREGKQDKDSKCNKDHSIVSYLHAHAQFESSQLSYIINPQQMSNEKDSVVNFLTPTKLITSTLKPKARNPSDSLFSLNKQKPMIPDDQSKNYNSQFERFNYGFNRSQEEVEMGQGQLTDSREKYGSNVNRNYMFENTSKGMLKSQDNFRINALDKVETKSENPQQSGFILHRVEVVEEPKEPYLKLVQNSAVQENVMRNSGFRENRDIPLYEAEKSNKDYLSLNSNAESLVGLISQLKAVKDTIETSLGELQYILDNTSKFLHSIDEEYSRIKQRVLDFTSQALDAGFTRYRQNMVNWAKYEQVELKTKLMIQQLDKTIKEDEIMVQEMGKISKNSRIIFSKQAELGQKVELYTNFVGELQRSKQECLSMRPQLKRERILLFQDAVSSLSDF